MNPSFEPLTRKALLEAFERLGNEPPVIRPKTVTLCCPACGKLMEVDMQFDSCPLCKAKWKIDENTRIL